MSSQPIQPEAPEDEAVSDAHSLLLAYVRADIEEGIQAARVRAIGGRLVKSSLLFLVMLVVTWMIGEVLPNLLFLAINAGLLITWFIVGVRISEDRTSHEYKRRTALEAKWRIRNQLPTASLK